MGSLFFAIAMVFGALVYASRANVVSSELRGAESQADRLLASIDHEFESLGGFTMDWAYWDELHAFVQNGNPQFIETNMDPEWFGEVDIDMVMFFDARGETVFTWGNGLGLTPRGLTAFADTFASEQALVDVDMATPSARGVIMVGSTAVLSTSHIILTSQGEGAPAGIVVFGRTLNTDVFARLAGVRNRSLGTFSLSQRTTPQDVTEAARGLSAEDRTLVRLTRPHSLTIYGLLLGAGQEPVAVLRADVESVAYQGTPQLIAWIVMALLIVGLLWSKLTFDLVERMSLSRMTWLKDAISGLTRTDDDGRRLDIGTVAHGDEISDVAEEVNVLLGVIEEAQKAQAQSERRNRVLIENMADSVFVVDLDGIITYASPQALSITGLPPEEIAGRCYDEILSAESRATVAQLLASPAKLDGRQILEVAFRHRNSKVTPAELSVSAVRGANQEVTAVQWIARDIAERKLFEQQLVRLANHDHLTGLYNRRHFEEVLSRRLAEARRREYPAALLWLDLDSFKDINDAFGHSIGDSILVALAETLRSTSRAEHVVARLGGDEFAVLLPHATAQEAHKAATRMLDEIRRALAHHDERSLHVTASIGIASFPDQATSGDELLVRADMAMYHAKQDGRNRVRIYTPDRDWEVELAERHTWASRIEAAIAEQRFVAYAQPIIDVTTDEPAYYELLVRIEEHGEVILPGEFLAHAESLDLIGEIDEWMLTEALAVLRQCASAIDARLTVNLSGNAFGDEGFLARAKELISESGVDPDRLGFEITETAVVRNMGRALHFMAELRAMGCTFSLDDFGSGFSSVYHLRHLPIDVLKIDGSLVRDLPRNPRDQHLVKAIIELARGLGMSSTAECVEDEATMALLREFGADCAQGFYVAKPIAVRTLFCDSEDAEQNEEVDRRA